MSFEIFQFSETLYYACQTKFPAKYLILILFNIIQTVQYKYAYKLHLNISSTIKMLVVKTLFLRYISKLNSLYRIYLTPMKNTTMHSWRVTLLHSKDDTTGASAQSLLTLSRWHTHAARTGGRRSRGTVERGRPSVGTLLSDERGWRRRDRTRSTAHARARRRRRHRHNPRGGRVSGGLINGSVRTCYWALEGLTCRMVSRAKLFTCVGVVWNQ